MEKKLTTSDGTKIAYDINGKGKTMLMIHGVTDCKESYDSDLSYLTEKYQVYRYDLRGHGNSDHPKKQFDLEDHINDGIELIKQLKLEDFVLYGGSLGSYIAQGIAVRIPERINKLILNVSAAKNPASALAETAKKDNIPEKTSERREYWIKHLTHDPKNIASIEKSGFQKNTLDAEDEYRALKSITAFDFRDQRNYENEKISRNKTNGNRPMFGSRHRNFARHFNQTSGYRYWTGNFSRGSYRPYQYF
ncbi:alpha/beta fold hydrolase [Oenococcus oeni]|uniref:alpha/beta fold hydrolase n=1 Tax=Oenococcus oeni TaxID=1247 RepID=UPI0029535675|nr:alpha/beta hydrolase [Oenococcus oeni]